MAILKTIGKIVLKTGKWYFIFNTLVWAVIGSGMGLNYLYADVENLKIREVGETFDHVFDEGLGGWKKFGFLIKKFYKSLL